mgnify:CR=1 FL=1
MKSLLKRLVTLSLKRNNKKITVAAINKGLSDSRVTIRHFIRDTFFVVLGVLSASLGLKGFLLPNGFIDGGVTGIALLVKTQVDINMSYLLVLFSIPFLILGYFIVLILFSYFIGRKDDASNDSYESVCAHDNSV